MPKGDRLTPKRDAFINRYLETGNATQAVVDTYDVKDRSVARAMGSEILATPNVQQEMQRRKGFSEETRAIVEAGLRAAIANAHECLLHEDPDVQKAARKDLIEASKLFEEKQDSKGNKTTHNHLHLPSRA